MGERTTRQRESQSCDTPAQQLKFEVPAQPLMSGPPEGTGKLTCGQTKAATKYQRARQARRLQSASSRARDGRTCLQVHAQQIECMPMGASTHLSTHMYPRTRPGSGLSVPPKAARSAAKAPRSPSSEGFQREPAFHIHTGGARRLEGGRSPTPTNAHIARGALTGSKASTKT